MTPDHDDRDLRERFDALRAEEGRSGPRFARLLERLPRAAAPRRTPALAAAAAVVLAASALWLMWSPSDSVRPRETARREVAIGEWRSETDFLLRTSGRELLQASPAVGGRWVIEPIAFPEAAPGGRR